MVGDPISGTGWSLRRKLEGEEGSEGRLPHSNRTRDREGVKKSDFPYRHHSGPRGWADWGNIRAEPTEMNYIG